MHRDIGRTSRRGRRKKPDLCRKRSEGQKGIREARMKEFTHENRGLHKSHLTRWRRMGKKVAKRKRPLSNQWGDAKKRDIGNVPSKNKLRKIRAKKKNVYT